VKSGSAKYQNASVLNLDLQDAIKKAQAEFAGSSEAQVKALWQQFEAMLNAWRDQGKSYVPIRRSDFRMQGKRRVWVGRGQGDTKPDYVDTFLQLANQRYALLPRFIRSLHRNVRIWTPPRLQTTRSLAVGYDCSRISGLLLRHPFKMLDPNGLFARQLPIALTGFSASDILGSY
jgi:hypothetical protein